MLSVIMLNAVYNPYFLSVVMLSVVMLSAVMLNVVTVIVVMQSIVAPLSFPSVSIPWIDSTFKVKKIKRIKIFFSS